MAREEVIAQIIELRRRTNRIIRDRALDSWVKLRLTTPQLKSLLYVTRHEKVNLAASHQGLGSRQPTSRVLLTDWSSRVC